MRGSTPISKIQSVDFYLSISPDEYLKYYRGQVKWVLAISNKGLKVRFPANLLSQHIAREGIKGKFRLKYLSNGKVHSLVKMTS